MQGVFHCAGLRSKRRRCYGREIFFNINSIARNRKETAPERYAAGNADGFSQTDAISKKNIPQSQNAVNGRGADGESSLLHTTNAESKGQSLTGRLLYTEALMRKAQREGNIYAERILKAQIEKAQRNSRSAGIDASAPMPTIYADLLKQREGGIMQQNVGAELLPSVHIKSYAEKEKQFGILYGEEAAKVDFEHINSNLHKDKFDQITASQKTNKRIYDISKTILRHCDGTEYEDLFLLDMDGETIANVTESEVKLGIIYSENFRNALADIAKNRIPVIAIHNHPHGTPPSPDDFRKAFENNYSIGVIVGHNGQVYIYSNTDVKLTREQTEQMADDIAMLYRMGWDIDRASRFIYDAYGLVYTIIEGG